jgi:uracil-DNA glycosylase family 4
MRVAPVIVSGAKIVLVGEVPTDDDVRFGQPFSGSAGSFLTSMLHEAGILRSDITITHVCPTRPPNGDIAHFFLDKSQTKPGPEVASGMADLKELLERIRPNLIIAAGRTALWALTGEHAIGNWRGSTMPCTLVPDLKVIPIYSPLAIFRMYEWRNITVHDLRRCKREQMFPEIKPYAINAIIEPSYAVVMDTLDLIFEKRCQVAADIETIARHIACLGLAWSPTEAICIPFAGRGGTPYWSAEQEAAIILSIQDILTTVPVIWQNGLYDRQHFAKHLGINPNHTDDTMIAQSVLFPGMQKSLDFLSSMYCENHIYWKDDLKDYHRYPVDIHAFWNYNTVDCCRTFEIMPVLFTALKQAGLVEQYKLQMKFTSRPVFKTMLRGVNIDRPYRARLAGEVFSSITEHQALINFVAGFELNVSSPKQMKAFFYDDLKLPVQRHRKSGMPSLDEKSLTVLARKEPLIHDLITTILQMRSMGVFLNTFIKMPLDSDNRMRSSFNPAGAETFRLSSSEDAFGSGGNLQNIPRTE